MKKYPILFISIFLLASASGQEVNKIGATSLNNINKIGSVPINSVGEIGNMAVQVFSKNCKEIKQNNPSATDGVYTIDPDGDGSIEPFDCFCDMTTDGGGWTLVGYYKDPADYDDLMYARADGFYGTGIADPNSSTAWTDWRVLAGVTWPIQFATVLDQETFSTWAELNAKVIYRVKSREIMPNYGTVQDLTSGDNLYYKCSFADGYSDVNTSSSSSENYWYPVTISVKYLICFHNTSGYSAYYGLGVPGGNDTWHHSARLFVR